MNWISPNAARCRYDFRLLVFGIRRDGLYPPAFKNVGNPFQA